MVNTHHIIDNQQATVAERLRRHLGDAHAFDFVSAYFSIYGYELLMNELDSIDEVRFLFGDPTSVEDLDPGAKDPKSFAVTEKGLTPNHTMLQRYLAKRCADWVRRESVAIRSVSQTNFLHGKMYLAGSGDELSSAVVGSSNFTKSGLGGSDRSNLEINLAVSDADTLAELQDWFDRLWKDTQRTEDVKQKVLDALARVGSDHAPEVVYYKTLYELFRKEIEARIAGDEGLVATGFYDSQVWNALYEFQKDGAKGAIAKLRQHNGCILADSVGLGKTYTALAVIKYFEQLNEPVLVLCPRKLHENWSLYQASNGHIQNPFPQDRFNYTLLAHTDLSRVSGRSGSVDLANFNWSNYKLVVIDESHNFRNSDGQRYQKLLKEIIAAGTHTKVLMLSATPVNTSLIDLRNQVYLMTEGREDDYRESLGVGSIGNMMAAAQRQFKEWESDKTRKGRRDKAVLLEKLGADFLRLLGGVSIARSRRHIVESYAAEMERIGQFPAHAAPVNSYPPTDLNGALSYKELADSIGQFKLAVYQPSNYVTDPDRLAELEQTRRTLNFNQQDSERFLVGMMRTNFLKRLESSAYSLTLTLKRTIGKIDALVEKIERYQYRTRDGVELTGVDVMPDEDEDDEEFFVNKGLRPYRLSELNLPGWLDDLSKDRATLTTVLNEVSAITPARDGKLREIKAAVREKATTPTADNDGTPNRKLLVFTTFKDTALYLYDNLSGLADELGINMAMVTGDETHTAVGGNTFNAILTNFAPIARNRRESNEPDIDLLIATDCISEGQNLQDCDSVLNYDIHWNPVRLIQRFGRIDRIGSRNPSVHMHNYWPTNDMDVYLKLENRVQARMALADIAATGSEDPFTDADAQLDLRFRDEQLLKLREEILDMDELADGPVMSDFTLDHFLAQLLRYLEKNRDMLEELPHGIYAVTEDKASAVQPGVVFFLRQLNAASITSPQGVASPIHPHYIVYIQDNGTIRFGCANARQALGVFEAASSGKAEPLTRLCDQFDHLTNFGKTMGPYDKLLNSVIAHIRQAHADTQNRNLRPGGARDFRFTPASEMPRSASDFELVTWLIMMDGSA